MILPGAVPDADLPLILHGAEIALYPSLYEGFGFPAVEALAAGVPLITSDRSSLPEVVGDAALLVDPESEEEIAAAIRLLLGDAAMRGELVRRGRARARELSWEATAQQVLELYRELA
jgi:glycosyltransferase involved in cell wall biosynthesis